MLSHESCLNNLPSEYKKKKKTTGVEEQQQIVVTVFKGAVLGNDVVLHGTTTIL